MPRDEISHMSVAVITCGGFASAVYYPQLAELPEARLARVSGLPAWKSGEGPASRELAVRFGVNRSRW